MDEQTLLARLRECLAGTRRVTEIEMFGGVGFMLNGNLLVAGSHRGLLVRTGKDAEPDALRRPGARPVVMRGRVMGGYVRVKAAALDHRAVALWVRQARRYVETLPKKPAKKPASRRKRRPAPRSR